MSLPGHHLARHLLDLGCRVAYLSAPVSPWHFLDGAGRQYVRRRWDAFGPCGKWVEENLFVYIPRTLVPVHHKAPFNGSMAAGMWARATFPNIGRILRREGFAKPDVLLIQNLQFPDLDRILEPGKLIYTVEDDIAHFDRVPKVLHSLEATLARRADLVTATALPLVVKMKALGAKRVLHHPNGVDWDHYRKGFSTTRPTRPTAVYVGALDAWFDEDLLAETASLLPEWKFVLAGPPRKSFPRLESLENVDLVGPVDREKVPGLLGKATAGIIPFKRTPLTDAVCPLKLFEYHAAGLPVVSTRMTEMENLASPAFLCADAGEFRDSLERCRTLGVGDFERFSEYARQYDWTSLLNRLLEAVMEKHHGN